MNWNNRQIRNMLLLPHPFPVLCGVNVSYESPPFNPVLRFLPWQFSPRQVGHDVIQPFCKYEYYIFNCPSMVYNIIFMFISWHYTIEPAAFWTSQVNLIMDEYFIPRYRRSWMARVAYTTNFAPSAAHCQLVQDQASVPQPMDTDSTINTHRNTPRHNDRQLRIPW